jgi:hypothetical protein
MSERGEAVKGDRTTQRGTSHPQKTLLVLVSHRSASNNVALASASSFRLFIPTKYKGTDKNKGTDKDKDKDEDKERAWWKKTFQKALSLLPAPLPQSQP